MTGSKTILALSLKNSRPFTHSPDVLARYQYLSIKATVSEHWHDLYHCHELYRHFLLSLALPLSTWMSGSYPCLWQIQISTMFKNSDICISFTHHRPGKNAQHYWSSLKRPQIKAWEEGQKRPERSESTNLERAADIPHAPSLLRCSASPLDGARATNTRQAQPLLRRHSASLMIIWKTFYWLHLKKINPSIY